ncbi:MAG: MFS transporter [Phenylobacterium sp.]|uniref:MFS transporter n=1 Tax=Phenylobacterium sp. TaxID=1871053 RepID=UPI001A36768B|nr:MFS transporter [Phenylobacterium sp.]MBL8772425.1 MFS transporter [Phenylobacterium sp.]
MTETAPGGPGDARPDPRPIRAGRIAAWLVWIVGTAFVVFKFFNQSSYAILSFGVARTFELSLEQVGWLGSVYTLAYAVVTFFCGSLFDRYGGRRVLAVGVAFIIAGATIFSTAQTWPALLAGQALMGVGGSFGFPGLAYLVRENFGALRFGIVFGVAQTVAAFSGAMLQQLAGLLIHTHSWREFLLMQAAVGVPILLAVVFLVRPTEASARLREARGTTGLAASVVRSVRGALKSRIVLEAALVSGVTFAAISGLGIVWGMRLLEARGFEPTAANSISAMIWMGIGGGAPAVALLAKAIKSHMRASLAFSLGALISVVAIAGWDQGGMTQYMVLFFLYGFFGGGASMSGYTMAAEAADSAVVGSAFSVITFAGFAISGLMLPIPGYLLDRGVVAGIEAAIWVYPAALALMIVPMVALRRGADAR